MSRKSTWLTSRAWVAHRLELYLSPSWRLAPVPLKRMLERLEIEHLRHGGSNNGELYVSFGQFEQHNISRRKIASAQALGAALGLMETIRAIEPAGDLRAPNAYRLTYLPAKGCLAPTDEWKRTTEDQARKLIDQYHNTERAEVKSREKRAA
ncbi:conserved hypothetical protein [Mesorhizobium prunaredense]|uniref:Uncharacterized protein n=1 Tax=Mesorhizobium prunaredense TaxID=1631249 RepID=A0A1R3V8K9_9HYPH|nr:hypothetical protein [Mesorhizobium prunaredense]SIT56248.1 conserved hypothetical protein [Mesorhizobium prunaredense]